MVDVRSMLRTERASRRINHPQAVYSSTGVLSCQICRIALKSESLWQSHLASTQHIASLRTAGARGSGSSASAESLKIVRGRKRKADDEEDITVIRKRSRPIDELTEDLLGESADDDDESLDAVDSAAEDLSHTGAVTTSGAAPDETLPLAQPSPAAVIDENEWAAFERDVATPPPDSNLQSVLTAEATIIAKPMTAAEIAAKSREEISTQARETREADMEGEKEDATRRLEEEFDEMEEMEGRVKRLKEKREELRRRRESAGTVAAEAHAKAPLEDDPGVLEDEEDEDEDDDDGWGNWGTR